MKNPNSQTSFVPNVYDASQPQGDGLSLNKILEKGPDRFQSILLEVIPRFRNSVVAVKGDVNKMYYFISLEREDSLLQGFLRRDLDVKISPQTYQVLVNIIGVKSVGCLGTLSCTRVQIP